MRWLVLLVALGACDSTTPAVARWQSARLEVGGMVFGVHWNDAAAEAYRLNPMAFPKMAAVAARAQVAIETASGCKVRSIGGDPAIVKAKLDCKGALPRRPGVRVETGDCYADESWRVEALGREYTGIECQLTVTAPG